ncbi:Serpin-ZXA [Platanthera guangdongensis]|uniref:Serpin-ZXA n=1 Tax=Platanthera guangdongensis TaxID=2320717 RepID=A0ABR2LWT9_9ASPA
MDLREAIAHQTSFSLQLASHVSSSLVSGSNLAFSTISIHAALALVAAGSKGETLQQILSVLRSGSVTELRALSSQIADVVLADGSPSGGPRLTFANGVWVDASLSLKPTFTEVLTSAYKAETKSVDFMGKAALPAKKTDTGSGRETSCLKAARRSFLPISSQSERRAGDAREQRNINSNRLAVEAREEVNSWVQGKTGGLIEELLPSGSVDNMTRLVLGNALYFKGGWHERFDSSLTKDSDFYLLDGSVVRAPFMTSKKKQYLSDYDDFKVLKMPYKQGDDKRQFSMYIFLPEARDGLSTLMEKLTSDSGFLNHHLPQYKAEVREFKIPKFKISCGFEASSLLKDLGLVRPFGAGADLTEMVDSAAGRDLAVSSIFHKSFVEVNEEGTEAAAATAAVVMLRGLPPPPLDFVADHPFVFVIREDKTGVVLFIGHLMNPQTA